MTAQGLKSPPEEEEQPELDFRRRPYETDGRYWDRITDQLVGDFDSYKEMMVKNARNEIKH
jgi:hypothetical protein